MIISSILVMIGHVTEIRQMYQFAVPTLEDFEIQYHIKVVENMDWVCLAPDRKVWKAPLNEVMCLRVV